jgi:hypothetical protein
MPAGEGPAERRLGGIPQGAADLSDAPALAQQAHRGEGGFDAQLGAHAEAALSYWFEG